MKVILLGATGMVGQGTLRECLLDPDVSEVLAIGRATSDTTHPKLRQIQHADLMDLSALQGHLAGFDACFYCLGVSSAGLTEAAYSRITYEFTVAVAKAVLAASPRAVFVFVSGARADNTGKSRSMWARVKGRAEKALLEMPFGGVYILRPAYIQPLHGVRSRTEWYNWVYALMRPLHPLWKALFPKQSTTTENIGRTMLALARQGYSKQVLESLDIEAVAGAAPRAETSPATV